jgi:hypothetical protein
VACKHPARMSARWDGSARCGARSLLRRRSSRRQPRTGHQELRELQRLPRADEYVEHATSLTTTRRLLDSCRCGRARITAGAPAPTRGRLGGRRKRARQAEVAHSAMIMARGAVHDTLARKLAVAASPKVTAGQLDTRAGGAATADQVPAAVGRLSHPQRSAAARGARRHSDQPARGRGGEAGRNRAERRPPGRTRHGHGTHRQASRPAHDAHNDRGAQPPAQPPRPRWPAPYAV